MSVPILIVRGDHNRALSLNHAGVLHKFMPGIVSNQS